MRRWITLVAVSVAAAVLVPAAPSAADSVPVTIFEDGFESGDLSNWDTVATHRFAVTSDLSRVHTGSYALEGTIDDGSPGSFEPGFQNMRGDGHGMHFASVKGNRIDDKWSSHGRAWITPDGTDYFVTTVDPDYTRGDPTLEPFTFYTYFPDKVGRWGNVFYQAEPAVPIIPGQWHEVIVHVNAGTPGRHDGSQALWIDGVKKIEVRHLRWRDTDDLRLNEFAIVDYMPAPPQTQHIWFDNIWVGTAFPGSEEPPPLPMIDPVNLTTRPWHRWLPRPDLSLVLPG